MIGPGIVAGAGPDVPVGSGCYFVCALPAAGVTPPPAPAAAFAATSVLTLGEARERGDLLRREIAHDDALYFRQAAPEISDFAYDQLKRELADLEAALSAAERGRRTTVAGGRRSHRSFSRSVATSSQCRVSTRLTPRRNCVRSSAALSGGSGGRTSR